MNRLKQPGKLIIWPSDLDSTKSRKEGRKLSKGAAVQVPRLDELNEAASRLSLEPELAPGKARPSSWWEKGGYIVLPKTESRTRVLRSLASEVKKSRALKASHEKPKK